MSTTTMRLSQGYIYGWGGGGADLKKWERVNNRGTGVLIGCSMFYESHGFRKRFFFFAGSELFLQLAFFLHNCLILRQYFALE